MSGIVPSYRGQVATADLRAGLGVRAFGWRDVAALNNWTLGTGAQLIPNYCPNITLNKTTEYTFQWRTRPRIQAFDRLWSIGIEVTSGNASSTATIEIPDAATAVTRIIHRFSATRRARVPFQVQHALSSQSASEEVLSMSIKCDQIDSAIRWIGCRELPRLTLETDTTDYGTDLSRLSPGQPILNSQLTRVFASNADSTLIGRRASLLQWGVPSHTGGLSGTVTTAFAASTTSSTFQNLFHLGTPVLARRGYWASPLPTKGTVTGKILTWVTVGGAGEVKFTTDQSGADTTPTSVTGASYEAPKWTDAHSINIHNEDLDSADGRQTAASPVWDLLQVKYRATSGTIYVAAVSVWED